MTRNKQIRLWISLILIAGSIAVFVTAAPAQNIHVLMVIDDANPRTGSRHTVDRLRIEALMNIGVRRHMFEKQRPDATVKMTELRSKDNQAKMDNILNWLQNVNPATEDVVFVYFSGPGGIDEADAKRRFLILQNDEKLYRKEIATLIEGMQCRLKILVTDTYNAIDTRQLWDLVVDDWTVDVLHNLFFEHEGFLNITSSAFGQIAISSSERGGYFTASLINGMFPSDMRVIDRKPQDGFVSWEEVFEFTKEDMNYFYESSEPGFPSNLKETLQQRNQTTQTPEVLSEFPKRLR